MPTMNVKQSVAHVVMRDPLGMHMRPAQLFSELATTFTSEIVVRCDTVKVDGKSIFEVLALAAECGAVITIEAKGDDADQATAALVELVENNFPEPTPVKDNKADGDTTG